MSYIVEHGERFLESTREILQDMFGVVCRSQEAVVEERTLTTDKRIFVAILFTGTIQGEYILALDESTAINVLSDGYPQADRAMDANIEEVADAFSEALNVIVGETIQHLNKDYKRLTFASPRVLVGQGIYPLIPTARGVLNTNHGSIECHFYLNLMKLNLTVSYHDALENYRQAQQRAEETRETIAKIMNTIGTGIFMVDEDLNLRPGYSAATRTILDLSVTDTNPNLQEIFKSLAENASVLAGFIPWVKLAFKNSRLDWHKDVLPLCSIKELQTRNGKTLYFNWIPIYNRDNRIHELMVIAEDITDRRALEKTREEMVERQEQNLELVSVLMNLESDEVITFLNETKQIIATTRKLAQLVKEDKIYGQMLERQMQRIKGGASQYNLGQLGAAAEAIEGEIGRLDGQDHDNPADIEGELEGLNQLVQHIEQMSGRINEGMNGFPHLIDGVKVPFDKIENLDLEIDRFSTKVSEGEDVLRLKTAVRHLREIDLFEHFSSVKGMLERMAERFGKRILFSFDNDLTIDVSLARQLIDPILQILRNAVEHGIETADVRERKGKNAIGIVTVSQTVQDEYLLISIEDDGAGIDTERLRENAIASGLIDRDNSNELSRSHLLGLIFKPGVTGLCTDILDKGRGLGLASAKQQLAEIGCEVQLVNEDRFGCKFEIAVPINSQQG